MTEEEIAALVAKNEELEKSTQSMQAKMDELLGEAKSAKEQRRQAEEAARQAEEEAAAKSGDYEKQYALTRKQLEEQQAAYNELNNRIAQKEQQTTAQKIAMQLADNDNADLLSNFIAPRLKYDGQSIKILDENGQETASSVDDLASEFKNNTRFSALLRGNQSTGGGANGGERGSGASEKTLQRSEFDQMNPAKQMAFIKSGGTTVD